MKKSNLIIHTSIVLFALGCSTPQKYASTAYFNDKFCEMHPPTINVKDEKYRPYYFDNGADYVSEGMFRIVDKRGRMGFADSLGNVIIKPRFAMAFPFEDGIAQVTTIGHEVKMDEYFTWKSNRWFLINKLNERVKK